MEEAYKPYAHRMEIGQRNTSKHFLKRVTSLIEYQVPTFLENPGNIHFRTLEVPRTEEVRPSRVQRWARMVKILLKKTVERPLSEDEERERQRAINDILVSYFGSDFNAPVFFLVRPEIEIDFNNGRARMGNLDVPYQDACSLYAYGNTFFATLTPLQIAAMGGDWATIEWLIAHGADPEQHTKDVPQTPLELLIALARSEQHNADSFENREVRQATAESFVRHEWDEMLHRLHAIDEPSQRVAVRDYIEGSNCTSPEFIVLQREPPVVLHRPTLRTLMSFTDKHS